MRVGFPVADTVGGLTAALAVTAALLRRERTGEGESIDVSMLEATLATMGWAVSNWLVAGQEPRPMGNDNATAAPSGTFRTRAGLLNVAANRQEQFVAVARAVGREGLASDPRFIDREARKRHRAALTAELEAALAADSAAAWAQHLNAAGVPAGEVLTVPEALAHPQVEGRGFVTRFEGVPGVVGREVAVARAGFRLASGDPKPATPPPTLGANTDAVLAELGLTPAEIAALREEGAA
jgi:crotonobetainyl-CoA:carnitine CoA-transferase CaiB-like acyl-CoA transferase